MCVVLRGSKFHYRFKIEGKDFSGPCPVPRVPDGASDKEIAAIRAKAIEAEMAEKERVSREIQSLREKEREIRYNKSVVALIENYKFELTGGQRISFKEAHALAAAKPSRRKAESSYARTRETYWNDFSAFMEANFPDITDLSAVRRSHCESYVSYLMEHGRFCPEVRYSVQHPHKRRKHIAYRREYLISAKTVKEIVLSCRWVFNKLEEDAGIVRDPWKEVVIPEGESIDREIFTADELMRIWNAMQDKPFLYHLFIIAANSGMPEGDICTLEWSQVDLESPVPSIRRKRRKTKTWISVPLLPQLYRYLSMLPRTGKYISPEHAEMYLRQPSCVSSRVKDFLNALGIETTVKIEGRKAQSVKDLHSMRHLFCYRAKRAGIPESSIMLMVGHTVLTTTQHYADHDTIEDLAHDIKKLPMLFSAGEPVIRDARRELAELAYSLPIEAVERLLATGGLTLPVPECS